MTSDQDTQREDVDRAIELAKSLGYAQSSRFIKLAHGAAETNERTAGWAAAIAVGGIGVIASKAVDAAAAEAATVQRLQWATACWAASLLTGALAMNWTFLYRHRANEMARWMETRIDNSQAKLLMDSLTRGELRDYIRAVAAPQPSLEDRAPLEKAWRRAYTVASKLSVAAIAFALLGVAIGVVRLGLLPI